MANGDNLEVGGLSPAQVTELKALLVIEEYTAESAADSCLGDASYQRGRAVAYRAVYKMINSILKDGSYFKDNNTNNTKEMNDENRGSDNDKN